MKMVPLGEIADIISGATPKSTVERYWGGDIHWATPADLGKLRGAFISETPRRLTKEGLASCAATLLPTGSVLLSSRAPIGHVAINEVPMATNQGFKSLIPHVDRIDSKYLYHWLRSKAAYLNSLGNGATFKELSKASVARIKVPVPALTKQRRIAAILDLADTLRVRRHQALAKIDLLTCSLFRSKFADAPAEISVVDLATFVRTGPFGSQLRHGEFVDDGVAVLGLDNVVGNSFSWGERRFITPEKYESLTRYTVHPGDVLISIMGTTGRCVVVPSNVPLAINTKHICAITLDRERFDPMFLRAAFLWHPASLSHLRRHTKGSIMAGLNMGIIKSMPVPSPPLVRQREFAAFSAHIEARRSTALHALAVHDELFASLQFRAFRGEL